MAGRSAQRGHHSRDVIYMERNMSQPIVDLVVAVVSVPLLVMFALLLQTQLQMSNNTGNHNRHYTNLREALFKPPPLKITTALPDIEPTTLRQEVDTWTRDTHARWTVLGLGLALLIVSLAVCIYVGQRLGICIRRKNDGCEMEEGGRDEDGYQSGSLMDDFIRREFLYSQGSSGTMRSLNSSLQLCLEQPPSYEAVVCYDLPPPPYCALTMSPGNDKIPGVHKNQQEAD